MPPRSLNRAGIAAGQTDTQIVVEHGPQRDKRAGAVALAERGEVLAPLAGAGRLPRQPGQHTGRVLHLAGHLVGNVYVRVQPEIDRQR